MACVLKWSRVCGIVYLLLMIKGGSPREDYNSNLFKEAGLVWIENFHGTMYFHHMKLTSDTWKRGSLVESPKLSSVIIARTNEFTFTHIDVAVGLNKTFVMVDTVGQRIVAFSFNEFGQHKPWVLFQGTSKKVNGIAIDWMTEVVYWTDAAYDVIMVASLEYPHHAEVVVDNLDEPFGIVVHPNKGFLFWTDADPDKSRLMRSTLGGRKVKAVVRFFSGIASTLHIDVVQDRLYWLFEMNDGGGQRIMSCDLYGNSKVETRVNGNHRYFDMDVFNDQMIFVNQENNQIHFYSKRRSDKHRNLLLDAGFKLSIEERPFGLRVIEPYIQQSGGNPCLLSACPGICTMSNVTENCFCIDALKQEADEQTVRMYCDAKAFTGLLLPKGDGIYTIWNNFGEYKGELPESVKRPTRVFATDHFISAITSDIRSLKIYFFDYNSKAIKAVGTEDGSESEIISLAVGNVWGLAFDHVSKSLFWTDKQFGHIMVTNEYGENPVVLHGDLDEPMEIAVHPLRRKLFWSERLNGALKVSYIDGSYVSTLIDLGSRRIKGIAVDFKTNMIYVCTTMSVIQIRELDDGNYTYNVVYVGGSHYFSGIAIMHDYIVVSDMSYRSSGLYSFEKPETATGSMKMAGKVTFRGLSLGNFYGVAYHHISNQPRRMSRCAIRKKDCDQLCLDGYRSERCVCGLGFITNGSRCEIESPFNPFLFVADQRYGKLFHVHALSGRFIAIPVQGLKQPYAITYDPVGRMVYWSDLETGTISRSDINGHQQKVIVYDPNSYAVCLEFDPGSRLLFFVSRHNQRPSSLFARPNRQSSSLLAYNVDTGRLITILNRSLGDTRSMALNIDNGYIFLVEQGDLLRVNMNGTILEVLIDNLESTAVTTVDQYIYYTNTTRNPDRLLIQRSDLDGLNTTVVVTLKYSQVRGLTIDRDQNRIYWTNSTTRAIYAKRMGLDGTARIEQIGPARQLMRPVGLFLNTIRDFFDSPCKSTRCDGICLPSGDEAVCKDALPHVMDIVTGAQLAGLCTIPSIPNADILYNVAGNVVPHGYTVAVTCYPQHRAFNDEDMTCRYGQWTNIPTCVLDYEICGTVARGYKVYRKSGVYFAYPEVTKVDVICIGGGGGGYDENNAEITEHGSAGDGGRSSFGGYLLAEGGKGGTKTAGGEGGYGHSSGGRGRYENNSCVTGGTAGQITPGVEGRPGYSHYLFCGAGGYSSVCKDREGSPERYSGPGGSEPEASSAGKFGGGAGSRQGGSGGGGGWSRLTVNTRQKEVIPVTVGEAGSPSYGRPAPGVVIVMWGGFRADERNDIIDTCVF